MKYQLKVIVGNKILSGKYSTLDKAVAEANRVAGKELKLTPYLDTRWILHPVGVVGQWPTAQIDAIK